MKFSTGEIIQVGEKDEYLEQGKHVILGTSAIARDAISYLLYRFDNPENKEKAAEEFIAKNYNLKHIGWHFETIVSRIDENPDIITTGEFIWEHSARVSVERQLYEAEIDVKENQAKIEIFKEIKDAMNTLRKYGFQINPPVKETSGD